MNKAEELFHKIASEIPDATEGKMFGALSIKAPNGKAAAMYWKENMVFKLRGDAYEEALSLDGSQLFDPMGSRPMKEWVQVPFDYADRWKKFTDASMEYVRLIKK